MKIKVALLAAMSSFLLLLPTKAASANSPLTGDFLSEDFVAEKEKASSTFFLREDMSARSWSPLKGTSIVPTLTRTSIAGTALALVGALPFYILIGSSSTPGISAAAVTLTLGALLLLFVVFYGVYFDYLLSPTKSSSSSLNSNNRDDNVGEESDPQHQFRARYSENREFL